MTGSAYDRDSLLAHDPSLTVLTSLRIRTPTNKMVKCPRREKLVSPCVLTEALTEAPTRTGTRNINTICPLGLECSSTLNYQRCLQAAWHKMKESGLMRKARSKQRWKSVRLWVVRGLTTGAKGPGFKAPCAQDFPKALYANQAGMGRWLSWELGEMNGGEKQNWHPTSATPLMVPIDSLTTMHFPQGH